LLTCSAAESNGIDALWSQVLKRHARFESTGRFEQHRRDQMMHSMRDLVNDFVRRVRLDMPELCQVSARVEAAVR
jgi:putative protein kinase ArgK-like GTPase of G3E family